MLACCWIEEEEEEGILHAVQLQFGSISLSDTYGEVYLCVCIYIYVSYIFSLVRSTYIL